MIKNALYIALIIHFLRKTLRKLLPRAVRPNAGQKTRLYRVLSCLRFDHSSPYLFVFGVFKRVDLAMLMAREIYAVNGENVYVVDAYLNCVDGSASSLCSKERLKAKFDEINPKLSVWSLFGPTASRNIDKYDLDKYEKISRRYGQTPESEAL